MAGNVVDFGFYLIQRGEAGHKRGCYTDAYDDATGKPLSSGSPVQGTPTIGYGLAKGHSVIPFPDGSVTEEQAIDLAKQELAYKINEMCRTKFKDFDHLLPCYQAAILDTTFQGNWKAIQDFMNQGDMLAVYEAITNNPNKERAAVRGRAIEMGIMVESVKNAYPNADPRQVAHILANEMIRRYADLNGTDCELTKDELALLYRTCMAAWGIEVSEAEIEQFALSFENVASGMAGIGSQQPATLFNGHIPQLSPHQLYQPRTQQIPDFYSPQNIARIQGRSYVNGQPGSFGSGDYRRPYIYIPEAIGPNKFEPDSKKLKVSTADTSPNYSSRCGHRPRMIVIHTTGSPHYGATKNTFQNPRSGVSAHYVIKPDGTIMQYLPEGVRAWHAGDSNFPPLGLNNGCNADSIGIEIECPDGQKPTPEQIATTMALTKDIQERHGLVRDNNGNLIKMPVVGHSDIAYARKVDPGEHFPWGAFDAEGISNPAHRLATTPQSNDPVLNAIRSTDCNQYITNQPEETQTTNTQTTSESSIAQAEKERKRQYAEQAMASAAATAVSAVHAEEAKLTSRLREAELAGQTPDETQSEKAIATNTSTEEETKETEKSGKKTAKRKKKSGGKKKALAKNNEMEEKQTDTDKEIETEKQMDDTRLADATSKKPIGTPIKDTPPVEKAVTDNGKGIA